MGYATTKPLPLVFDAAVSDPGRWTPGVQMGAVALAQMRAGGACLRTAHGAWDADRTDQRCAMCMALGEREAEIPRETVVHVLGDCAALEVQRARFVERYKQAVGARRHRTPSARRIAIWVLRQDPQRGDPADATRLAMEFAKSVVEVRHDALRRLGLD